MSSLWLKTSLSLLVFCWVLYSVFAHDLLSTSKKTHKHLRRGIEMKASTLASLSAISSQSTKALPPMLYGTAWKKENTQKYVEQAVRAGFINE